MARRTELEAALARVQRRAADDALQYFSAPLLHADMTTASKPQAAHDYCKRVIMQAYREECAKRGVLVEKHKLELRTTDESSAIGVRIHVQAKYPVVHYVSPSGSSRVSSYNTTSRDQYIGDTTFMMMGPIARSAYELLAKQLATEVCNNVTRDNQAGVPEAVETDAREPAVRETVGNNECPQCGATDSKFPEWTPCPHAAGLRERTGDAESVPESAAA